MIAVEPLFSPRNEDFVFPQVDTAEIGSPQELAVMAIIEEAADVLYAAAKRRIVRDIDARSRHQFRGVDFCEWPPKSREFWLERVVSCFGWLEMDLTRGECSEDEERQLAKMAGALFAHALQARIKRTGSLQNAWQTEEFLTAKMQEEMQELNEARQNFISLLSLDQATDFADSFPPVEIGRRLPLVVQAFKAGKTFGVRPLTLMQFVVAKQEARIALNKNVLTEDVRQQLWQDLLPIADRLLRTRSIAEIPVFS